MSNPDAVLPRDEIETTPIGLLTGKVVFITGASRGIGAAAARLFAVEGAAVVLAARSADALELVVKEVLARASTQRSTASRSCTGDLTAPSTTEGHRSSSSVRLTPRPTRTSTNSSP